MKKYNPKKIEPKWQKYWEEQKTFEVREDPSKNKFYGLIEFPYPSGAGLHVGHPRSYTAMDVICRKRRMEGFNVLYPIGFDAFGLPTENYAIKTGRPPAEVTAENIATFTRQLKELGFGFDWSRVVDTTDPAYYKWTQWIFLQLFKHGLAYKANQPINWCLNCKIGLANEEVVDGRCERCGGPVEKRNKEQWMLAITKYADSLLKGLDEVDYIERAKVQQTNWIGRSEGATIGFNIIPANAGIQSSTLSIEVFTTRPDTIFGATYLVIAPEHEFISNYESLITNYEEVESYVDSARRKTDIERTDLQKEKTGVELKGIKALNPVNGKETPIWVADFVLGQYGTGAVFADAHDERDFEFAKKYHIPLKVTIRPDDDQLWEQVKNLEVCYTGDGAHFDSNFLDGLRIAEAKEKIIQWLEEQGVGKRQVNYKLRDWVFSRQRYWGEPIPLVYCEACKERKYNYIIIHGFTSTSQRGFKPWLQAELEKQGHIVWNPDLPNTDRPNIEEQVQFVLDNAPFSIDEHTILVGHSLGGALVYRILEKIQTKIRKAVLVDPVFKPEFNDTSRPAVASSTTWNFDWKKIQSSAGKFILLADKNYPVIKKEHLIELASLVKGDLWMVEPSVRHFSIPEKNSGSVTVEPEILRACVSCGWIPLPESELPLKLPEVEKYQPTDTGESPLAAMTDWVKTACPRCGGPARRETDTMPNWAGSSWYFLRYCDPENDKELASMEKLNYWMGIQKAEVRSPKSEVHGGVDWYNGGMEHTVLHLLYSRFWNQFLYDIGAVPTWEPYAKRTSHGMILASDGQKMSKSLGNVVNPDDMVEQYGADALRTYILFMGPFDQVVAWDTNGLVGARRFLDRVWNLQCKIATKDEMGLKSEVRSPKSTLHQTIKKVTEDIETMRFNTAIAKLMELTNEFTKSDKLELTSCKVLLKLLSPFAPHLCEELWVILGENASIAFESWPTYDPALIVADRITLAVQVNGKLRDTIEVDAAISEEEAKQIAIASGKVQKYLNGKEPSKVIYVKGKLVSIVI